jgi:putative oxidoreductase
MAIDARIAARKLRDLHNHAETHSAKKGANPMKYVVLLGRILFAAIFLMAGPKHFTAGTIGYAAAAGVPVANILVPISGLFAILGGLSILLGFHARYGAWLIVLFLVPVSFSMHAFWADADPKTAAMNQVMFMKNMSMLGGALLIAHFGSGPLSLDSVLCKKRTE